MTKQYAAWTMAQIGLLKKIYPGETQDYIERMLAPHPWKSIKAMARRYRVRRFRHSRDWNAVCAAHVMQSGWFEGVK